MGKPPFGKAHYSMYANDYVIKDTNRVISITNQGYPSNQVLLIPFFIYIHSFYKLIEKNKIK